MTKTEYKFEITMQSPSTKPEDVQEAVEKALSYISGSVEVKPVEHIKEPDWYEHEFIVKVKSTSNNRDLALCELHTAIEAVLPTDRFVVFQAPVSSHAFPTLNEFKKYLMSLVANAKSLILEDVDKKVYDFFTKKEKGQPMKTLRQEYEEQTGKRPFISKESSQLFPEVPSIGYAEWLEGRVKELSEIIVAYQENISLVVDILSGTSAKCNKMVDSSGE